MSAPPTPIDRETVDIPTVAQRLGIHRSTAYELAKVDQLPVPTIRLGRRLVVSRHALDQLLAGGPDHGEAA